MVLLSHEQQAIEALPEDVRQSMARLVLAGWRFQRRDFHDYSWWNAIHPVGGGVVARSTLLAVIEVVGRGGAW